MRHASFVRQIEDAFWPTLYETVVKPPPAPLDLLLTVRRGPARYALAVGRHNALDSLAGWRQLAFEALEAAWLWREVGLYLVLTGPAERWDARLRPDRTGFHAVIVQGIHLVDLEARRSELRASRWGPVVFGGSAGVGERIDQLLGDQPPESVLP